MDRALTPGALAWVAVLSATLPFCARAETPPPLGGKVTASLPSAPHSLDPLVASSYAEITLSSLVFDTLYRRGPDGPLRIPEGAVVVPGSRRLGDPFAERHGLSLATPVIVKYRDAKTDARIQLEDLLR